MSNGQPLNKRWKQTTLTQLTTDDDEDSPPVVEPPVAQLPSYEPPPNRLASYAIHDLEDKFFPHKFYYVEENITRFGPERRRTCIENDDHLSEGEIVSHLMASSPFTLYITKKMVYQMREGGNIVSHYLGIWEHSETMRFETLGPPLYYEGEMDDHVFERHVDYLPILAPTVDLQEAKDYLGKYAYPRKDDRRVIESIREKFGDDGNDGISARIISLLCSNSQPNLAHPFSMEKSLESLFLPSGLQFTMDPSAAQKFASAMENFGVNVSDSRSFFFLFPPETSVPSEIGPFAMVPGDRLGPAIEARIGNYVATANPVDYDFIEGLRAILWFWFCDVQVESNRLSGPELQRAKEYMKKAYDEMTSFFFLDAFRFRMKRDHPNGRSIHTCFFPSMTIAYTISTFWFFRFLNFYLPDSVLSSFISGGANPLNQYYYFEELDELNKGYVSSWPKMSVAHNKTSIFITNGYNLRGYLQRETAQFWVPVRKNH